MLTDISRRSFLGLLGVGAAGLVLPSCGTPSGRPDAGSRFTDAGMRTGVPSDFRLEANFADLPSHYSSSLHYYAERILGVGDHIFSLDPRSSTRPVPTSLLLDLPEEPSRYLNHLGKRPSGTKATLTANDGFYELSVGSMPSQRFIAFPSGNNFGGGAVYTEDKLFVAVANGMISGSAVSFGTGRVLIYPLSLSGDVQEADVRMIDVTGQNPTGLALRDASTLVVLNSGPSHESLPAESSLDLIDIGSETILRTIPLGAFRAQLSGGLAITAGGSTAVIGSSDGAGVLFVDLDSAEIISRSMMRIMDLHFHSSVNVENDLGIASVTDFNLGSVTFFNLATQAIIRSVMLGFVEAGPSLFYNGDLIQSGPDTAARVYPV